MIAKLCEPTTGTLKTMHNHRSQIWPGTYINEPGARIESVGGRSIPRNKWASLTYHPRLSRWHLSRQNTNVRISRRTFKELWDANFAELAETRTYLKCTWQFRWCDWFCIRFLWWYIWKDYWKLLMSIQQVNGAKHEYVFCCLHYELKFSDVIIWSRCARLELMM